MSADKQTASVDDPRVAFFDRLAAEWDVSEQDPRATVARLGELAEYLDLRPGYDLLEVGCGTGQLTGWLAERVAPGKVVAVDFAPSMVAEARAKGDVADFRVADVCSDPLGNACFDVALCFHSFPHFRDQPVAIQNLARALKPGGSLLVMHFSGSRQVNAFHDQVGGAVAGDHLPPREDWERMLATSGLSLTQFVDREDLFLLKALLRTCDRRY